MRTDLNSFMNSFCKAGARAIRRYVSISGEPVRTMPEYLLSSSLFLDLGSESAVTLETPLSHLHSWLSAESNVFELAKEISRWRLDMIVYDGGGDVPSDQKAWALVEIKNGYIDADFLDTRRSDRVKLLKAVEWFTQPLPHLICAGSLNAEGHDYHCRRAKEANDQWFVESAGELDHGYGEMWFGARVLTV